MTRTFDAYSIDHNVQLVIDDVRALREKIQGGPDEATSAYLTQLTAGYFVVNRPILDRAFAAWRETSEEELGRMCAQFRTLDAAASRHAFDSVAWHLIPLAADIVRNAKVNLISIDEDDLNMLLRVLEYAKYLANCSDEPVHWHPVSVAAVDDRVEQLRENLPAE